MKQRCKDKCEKGANAGAWITMLLLALMLALVLSGTANLAQQASDEGVNALYTSIERATVLCYATEGFYPPGLSYIEENYGVRIDEERFVVRYEIYAANVMPVIRVAAR